MRSRGAKIKQLRHKLAFPPGTLEDFLPCFPHLIKKHPAAVILQGVEHSSQELLETEVKESVDTDNSFNSFQKVIEKSAIGIIYSYPMSSEVTDFK